MLRQPLSPLLSHPYIQCPICKRKTQHKAIIEKTEWNNRDRVERQIKYQCLECGHVE